MPENKWVIGAVNVSSSDVKCPGCGASIGVKFDAESLNLKCPFCGLSSQLPQPGSGKAIEELDFNSALQRASINWGHIKKLIICANCGGQTLYNAEQVTGACPFCGSTSVTPAAENVQIMAPQAIIPFSITKEKAQEYFTDFLNRKSFVSQKVARSKLENIVGIYLPFWTFDAQTVTSYLGAVFDVEKEPAPYVTGFSNRYFDDLVIYASDRIRMPEIGRVQDFDFTKMVPYSSEYLAGIPAERYTVGLNDSWERSKIKMRKIIRNDMYEVGKRRFSVRKFTTDYYNVKFRYLLAPVYIARYTFGKESYQVAINGQTGKTYCEAPTYLLKLILLIILIVLVGLGISVFFMWLMHYLGLPMA